MLIIRVFHKTHVIYWASKRPWVSQGLCLMELAIWRRRLYFYGLIYTQAYTVGTSDSANTSDRLVFCTGPVACLKLTRGINICVYYETCGRVDSPSTEPYCVSEIIMRFSRTEWVFWGLIEPDSWWALTGNQKNRTHSFGLYPSSWWIKSKTSPIALYNINTRQNPFKSTWFVVCLRFWTGHSRWSEDKPEVWWDITGK
jgi:hypothetical protein